MLKKKINKNVLCKKILEKKKKLSKSYSKMHHSDLHN